MSGGTPPHTYCAVSSLCFQKWKPQNYISQAPLSDAAQLVSTTRKPAGEICRCEGRWRFSAANNSFTNSSVKCRLMGSITGAGVAYPSVTPSSHFCSSRLFNYFNWALAMTRKELGRTFGWIWIYLRTLNSYVTQAFLAWRQHKDLIWGSCFVRSLCTFSRDSHHSCLLIAFRP